MNIKYRKKDFKIDGVSQEDHIYKTIVKQHGFYEIDLLEYMYSIKRYLHGGIKIAIDVGANIGNHSIFFRSFLTDYVIAIEPNPDVLPILYKNLNQNINNFVIYDNALGEHDSVGKLVVRDGAQCNLGMARIEIAPDANDNVINIITLDSVIGDIRQKHHIEGNVSLIKVDVEGMELAVLRGAKNTIETHKPHLFVEAATHEEFKELDNFLGNLGYKMLSRWASTHVYHFCYNPPKSLLITVRSIKFYRAIMKIKAKVLRRLKLLAKR